MQTTGHVLVGFMISLSQLSQRVVHMWNLLRRGDQNLGARRWKD